MPGPDSTGQVQSYSGNVAVPPLATFTVMNLPVALQVEAAQRANRPVQILKSCPAASDGRNGQTVATKTAPRSKRAPIFAFIFVPPLTCCTLAARRSSGHQKRPVAISPASDPLRPEDAGNGLRSGYPGRKTLRPIVIIPQSIQSCGTSLAYTLPGCILAAVGSGSGSTSAAVVANAADSGSAVMASSPPFSGEARHHRSATHSQS